MGKTRREDHLRLSAFICGSISVGETHPQNEFGGATHLHDGRAGIPVCHPQRGSASSVLGNDVGEPLAGSRSGGGKPLPYDHTQTRTMVDCRLWQRTRGLPSAQRAIRTHTGT